MSLIYPAGISVDAKAKKCTSQFFEVEMNSTYVDPEEQEAAFLALIEAGICLEAKDAFGNTPLLLAASREYQAAIVKKLIDAGADIEARNNIGVTPLYFASQYGAIESINTLLKAGADIEARNDGGTTPLCRMAWDRKADRIKILLERGANIYVEDGAGLKPINWLNEELLNTIAGWQQQYESFVKNHTAPKSAKDVYHLLAVYPLIDPKAPVDRETHLRQIFFYAKWPDKERPREIITQLREDGSISAALAESLLAMMQPAKASILENHGRGR